AVLLVRADDPAGAALDPAGDVLARPLRTRPTRPVEHAAVVVGDRAGALVERHARQRLARVAGRAEHELAGDRLLGPRHDRAQTALAVLDELGAPDAHALD